MGTITVIDHDGKQHTLNATDGLSVMEIIYDAGLPIKAACFGCCSCSTCHVYVDEAWLDKIAPPSSEEEEILDMVIDLRGNSRLSCQIPYNPGLDGLGVALSEDAKPD
jgi:2Fe-2S ferredoxin